MRLALLLLLAYFPAVGRAADSPGVEHFEKHVRPILVEKCLSCHAGEKPKGGLKLDSRDAVLTGGQGGTVVVPGKAKESRLIAAVRHLDEDLKMPPAGKLAEREIASLEKWVDLGMPWPERSRSPRPMPSPRRLRSIGPSGPLCARRYQKGPLSIQSTASLSPD
jgi:hypothetical protein